MEKVEDEDDDEDESCTAVSVPPRSPSLLHQGQQMRERFFVGATFGDGKLRGAFVELRGHLDGFVRRTTKRDEQLRELLEFGFSHSNKFNHRRINQNPVRAATAAYGVRGLVRAFARRLVAVKHERSVLFVRRSALRGSALATCRQSGESGDKSPHSKSASQSEVSYFTESRGTILMLSTFMRFTGRSPGCVAVVPIFSNTSSPLMSLPNAVY